MKFYLRNSVLLMVNNIIKNLVILLTIFSQYVKLYTVYISIRLNIKVNMLSKGFDQPSINIPIIHSTNINLLLAEESQTWELID